MEHTANDGAERRKNDRTDYTGHIVVGRPTRGTVLFGAIMNLSIGGCLMRLHAPMDLRPDAIVEVGIEAGPLSFTTLGSIRRHETDAHLIGLEFLNLGLEGRRSLRALIAGFRKHRDPELDAEFDPEHHFERIA